MRASKRYLRPMVFIAVAFSLFACIDRSDPTAPGSPSAPSSPTSGDVVTVTVELPVASLEVGKQADAVATTKSDGQTVDTASIEWSSSDTSILVVSNKGVVSARKMGAASIWATWHKWSGKGSLSVTDTVPAKIVVSPSTTDASVGKHVQLSASVATVTGRALPGHPVRWVSTDTRYVTVSSTGMVTGAAKGNAKVVATASSAADTVPVDIGSAAIANLSISPATTTLSSGATQQLTALATDADGNVLTGRSVGWASSDESVATVSTSGVVTGAKAGNATISAMAEGINANAAIRVVAGSAKNVAIHPGSIGLVAGATQQLTASLTDESGNALSTGTVTWSSSDNNVATISSSGLVTAHRAGSASISAAADGATGTATVAVSAGAVKSISVSPSTLSLVTGGTRQLSAALTDASGNPLTGEIVAWSSSDNSVATVSSNGMVTAKHSGNAVLTAAAGGASDNASLTVSAGDISSVSVSPGSVSLPAGGTQQLVATLQDNTGSAITGQTVTWSSSDASVVSVSSSGLATVSHIGSATVTATAGGKSGHALFSVTAGGVSSVSVTPSSGTVDVGKTLQLSVSATDAAGNAVAGRTAVWASSNSSAATVNSGGLVTGVAAGSSNISATVDGKSESATITVSAAAKAPATLSSIVLSPNSVSLASGASQGFSVSATWSDGSTTAPSVTYSATGGTITTTGTYTAGSTAGSFRVVAVSGSKSDSSIVTITAPTAPAAPTLTRLTIAPGSASLSPNGTAQFSVAGTWSNGGTTAPAATYSATGGTITPGGLYTAASANGTFRVIATQTGHTLADTAIITIAGSLASAGTCDANPHTRVVAVSTSAQLHAALAAATPGDLIEMANGTYGDGSEFRLLTSGTASQPITVCGSPSAIIDAGSVSGRDGMKLSSASYAKLDGFTITNALFGVWIEKSVNTWVNGLTIHSIGQEGIEMVQFSKNAHISNNRIYDTGRVVAEYGEAIYVGSANAKWAALTAGQPDATDSVLIEGNNIGPDVRAEHIDAKEGTHGGIIRNNTFNGAGMVESQGSGDSGWPNSWVILQGVGYHVTGNTGTNALAAGFRVVTHGTVETGLDNVFSGNSFNVNGAHYGFLIQTGSGNNGNGNVVSCSNSVQGATVGLANVACQ